MKEKITHYIRVIRKTPPGLLFKMLTLRIKSIISDFYNYMKVKAKGPGLSDDEFIKELKIKDEWNGSVNFLLEHFVNFEFLNNILSNEDKKFLKGNISASEKSKIIEGADKICRHGFNLLGSGEVVVGFSQIPEGFEGNKYEISNVEAKRDGHKKRLIKKLRELFPESLKNVNIDYRPIDWHRDFKSGYRWDESVWYKKIKYGHKPGIDIKIPWEISRSQHLVTLGQAYVLTGEERYVKEYIYQLIDWIENNTIQFGPNWTCTMDVAIRAANWVMSLAYFIDSKHITDRFLFYLIRNIYCHGKHIVNNLEYGSITSNHYLSDISGLFFIASFFKKNIIGRKWLDFSLKELKEEMKKQVYEDGVDFEASTSYHRLVLELFFYPALYAAKDSKENDIDVLLNRAEKYFGEEYIDKLKKMFGFILAAVKPDGTIPQIGDNDNGRLFIFSDDEILDLRYLLVLGTVFFNDSGFKIKEYGFNEGAFWLFGDKGFSKWDELDCLGLSDIGSRDFRDSGFFIMRDNEDYLFSSCGPNGQKDNGGHAHNDKLGFELMLGGENIFVDPGTFIYTPSTGFRNMLRSTSSHNTVTVDREEQNRLKDNSLFSLENDAIVRINKWCSKNEYDFLDAEHYGYKRLNDPVIHRRQITFIKAERLWLIRDILYGKEIHSYELTLQLFKGLDPVINKNTLISRIKTKNIGDLYIVPLDRKDLSLNIEESIYSGSYGSREDAKNIKYTKKSKGNTTFITVISEYKDIGIINKKLKTV